MDYKYIEQLLERYWLCETSLEEEDILKSFFSQEEVPAHLMPYKRWFAGAKTLREAHLGDGFDEKVLARIDEETVVRAKRITFTRRLMPLYKAAASIAIVLVLGDAAQSSFRTETSQDYNYETYQDSYQDPEMAYSRISDALHMVSQSMSAATKVDSLLQEPHANQDKEQ